MKTKLRTLFMSLFAACLCLALAGTALAAEKITLRIGNTTAPDHILNVTLEEMAKAINERSGGRIEATVYPSSQLGSLRSMTE
ncbi:MAG: C4-dicarboxylate ABC transporter substrate-binding protein, partial [Candidatus Adiutrix sp.]|nr:C4-dicarboxylate ABC transporter substrate-binding protein [Candidatus Adiutrix sp.]